MSLLASDAESELSSFVGRGRFIALTRGVAFTGDAFEKSLQASDTESENAVGSTHGASGMRTLTTFVGSAIQKPSWMKSRGAYLKQHAISA